MIHWYIKFNDVIAMRKEANNEKNPHRVIRYAK